MILKDGGHYGFRHLDWFSSFIDKAYILNREFIFQLFYGDKTIPLKPTSTAKQDTTEKLKSGEFRDIFKYGIF